MFPVKHSATAASPRPGLSRRHTGEFRRRFRHGNRKTSPPLPRAAARRLSKTGRPGFRVCKGFAAGRRMGTEMRAAAGNIFRGTPKNTGRGAAVSLTGPGPLFCFKKTVPNRQFPAGAAKAVQIPPAVTFWKCPRCPSGWPPCRCAPAP